ncbi:MAG: hypothetical protein ACREH8_06595 [Opitutaceae bacterium]
MNRLAIALVVSAATVAVSSARADTRVHVGVSFGSPAYHHRAPVVVRAPAPTVVYAVPPTVMYAPPRAVVVAAPRGYWKEIQVKTWVPERWFVRTNRWGRAERFCEPGYFTYRTDRVWVDRRSDHRHGYAYGYNHHRHSHR